MSYPVTFSVDYPDRPLKRLSTFFRIFAAIPILIVYNFLIGTTYSNSQTNNFWSFSLAASGILVISTGLMIVFRRKYPKWWFDWTLELMRFGARISVYLFLMDDHYPSTDDHQSVHLDYPYPDASKDLNRWLPLVKGILAIPHFLILIVLYLCAVVCVITAWFAILFTGRYPKVLFNFVVGVYRWNTRVAAYAIGLVTDKYPPFRLSP